MSVAQLLHLLHRQEAGNGRVGQPVRLHIADDAPVTLHMPPDDLLQPADGPLQRQQVVDVLHRGARRRPPAVSPPLGDPIEGTLDDKVRVGGDCEQLDAPLGGRLQGGDGRMQFRPDVRLLSGRWHGRAYVVLRVGGPVDADAGAGVGHA